eukprot:scaffold3270_cov170-Isochrysis_galbana.AAC.3
MSIAPSGGGAPHRHNMRLCPGPIYTHRATPQLAVPVRTGVAHLRVRPADIVGNGPDIWLATGCHVDHAIRQRRATPLHGTVCGAHTRTVRRRSQ